MNRNLKSWARLKIPSASKVTLTCRETHCIGRKQLSAFSDFSFCFSGLTFQEFTLNNFNLVSTNLRQKENCSHCGDSQWSEIRSASLKGREGWWRLLPLRGGAAEADCERRWLTSSDPFPPGVFVPSRENILKVWPQVRFRNKKYLLAILPSHSFSLFPVLVPFSPGIWSLVW